MYPTQLIGSLATCAALVGAPPFQGHAARSDLMIQLPAATFDPLEGLPSGLDEALTIEPPVSGPGRWIIQFRGPLTRDQRARLASRYGLRLDDPVRHHAFLETVTRETLTALRVLPFFRAEVYYQPAFKIAPGIGEVEYRTEYRRGIPGLLLRAVLFEDADLDAVATALRRLPGISEVRTYDDRVRGGVARILFQASSAASLPAVARIEAVRTISEVGEIIDDVRDDPR